jgi:Tfp pilus assembly protein PilV
MIKHFKKFLSKKTESAMTSLPSSTPGKLGNESGFSLIEVMIVSVIAIVLGLAIAEMQSQQAKTTKRLEVKTSAQDFYNVLKFQIVNSAVQTANQ